MSLIADPVAAAPVASVAQGAANLDPRQELHALLDMQLALPPEYRDGLSSHLPMALQALFALGADATRLQAFYRRYAARFDGRRAEPPAPPAADWRAQLGQPASFEPLRARFACDLARDGREALLRRVLPSLLPGVGGAAFHGAIRVAHAVEAGHDGELAAALAYWGWRWQPLPDPHPTGPLPAALFGPGELTPEAWMAAVQREAQGQRFAGGLISVRMLAAVASPTYAALADALAPAVDLLPRLAACAAGSYAQTRNFTLLHLVTALNALQVLSPWIETPLPSLARVLGRQLAAAWLAAQVGEALAPLPVSNPHDAGDSGDAGEWAAVTTQARDSDDDHVIKLVQACRSWHGRAGDARFLAAARRAVG